MSSSVEISFAYSNECSHYKWVNVYSQELTRIPNASLKVLLRLALTLRRDTPATTNAVIDLSAAELDAVTAEIRDALIARQIADNPELIATELEFDFGLDGVWIALRRALELQQAFAHRGLDALPGELAQAGSLEQLRARAKSAQRLWERLFGAHGTSFTKSKFIEQAESMATLLGMLEQEGLRAELEAAVGEQHVALLYAAQKHYEDMVSGRLSRRSPGANLTELRRKLRFAIIGYVNAVHSLARLDQPESHARVLEALQSIVTLRGLLTRRVTAEELEAGLEAFVDAELEQGAAADAQSDDEAA